MMINMKNYFGKVIATTSLVALIISGCGKKGEDKNENSKVMVSDTVAVQVAKVEKSMLSIHSAEPLRGKNRQISLQKFPKELFL